MCVETITRNYCDCTWVTIHVCAAHIDHTQEQTDNYPCRDYSYANGGIKDVSCRGSMNEAENGHIYFFCKRKVRWTFEGGEGHEGHKKDDKQSKEGKAEVQKGENTNEDQAEEKTIIVLEDSDQDKGKDSDAHMKDTEGGDGMQGNKDEKSADEMVG